MEEDDGCIEGVDEQEDDECVQEAAAAVVVAQGDVSIADETNTSIGKTKLSQVSGVSVWHEDASPLATLARLGGGGV